MLKLASKYLLQGKILLLVVSVACLVSAAISIIIPYLTAKFIDTVLIARNLNSLSWFVGLFCVLTIAEIAIGYFSNIYSAKLQAKAAFNLNANLITHTQKLPLGFFQKYNSAYLTQRINDDAHNIVGFVLGNFINIIVNSISLIAVIGILLSIETRIFPWFLAVIALYLLIYILFRKPLRSIALKNKEAQNSFFANLEQQFRYIKFVKINVLYSELALSLRKRFGDLLDIIIKRTKIAYWFSSSGKIAKQAFTISIFAIGGLLVIKGEMTVGNFVVVNSYFAIALGCIMYFLNLGQDYQNSMAAYDRICELLEYPNQPLGDTEITTAGKIELKNIGFSYKDEPLLNNFNYEFLRGNIYGIVGPNGIGKTTLIYLIVGLLKPTTGSIWIDGHNLETINSEYWRKHSVAFLEQEPVLLKDTLFNNLLLGNDNNRDIDKWINRIGLNEFFNDGRDLQYIIDEQLTSISGGEKQKIAQIRTFLKNSSLVILDEPISAIDSEGIEKLAKILKEIKHDKIIIYVTHKRELLVIADEIIDFEKKISLET